MLHVLQASVSHNMRTPLNAITVCADMLLDIVNLSSECINLLNPIRYASKILTCHVNDLLDFNLILKGQFKPTVSKMITKDTIHAIV
jgi:K+-sensing histidine kinase KdpD